MIKYRRLILLMGVIGIAISIATLVRFVVAGVLDKDAVIVIAYIGGLYSGLILANENKKQKR